MSKKAIYLTEFTVGILKPNGLTLLTTSDLPEGGGYVPPAEMFLPHDALERLVTALATDKAEA